MAKKIVQPAPAQIGTMAEANILKLVDEVHALEIAVHSISRVTEKRLNEHLEYLTKIGEVSQNRLLAQREIIEALMARMDAIQPSYFQRVADRILEIWRQRPSIEVKKPKRKK